MKGEQGVDTSKWFHRLAHHNGAAPGLVIPRHKLGHDILLVFMFHGVTQSPSQRTHELQVAIDKDGHRYQSATLAPRSNVVVPGPSSYRVCRPPFQDTSISYRIITASSYHITSEHAHDTSRSISTATAFKKRAFESPKSIRESPRWLLPPTQSPLPSLPTTPFHPFRNHTPQLLFMLPINNY
jgi:hypothetical protein